MPLIGAADANLGGGMRPEGHLDDKRVADADAKKYGSTYYNSIDVHNYKN